MTLLALGFASGLGLAVALPQGLSLAFAGLGLALFALGASKLHKPSLVCLLWLLAGLCAGLWRVQPGLQALAAPGFERQEGLSLQGRVSEDLGVAVEDRRASVLLDSVMLNSPQGLRAFEGKVKLTWESSLAPGPFKPGDRLSCLATLRPPSPPDNPGEFDYRSYLLSRNIRGLASAKFGIGPALLCPGSAWDPRRWAWSLRQGLLQGLARALPRHEAAFCAAVALGDRRGLPKREVEGFARSGLAYLMAVAGLHLAMALGLFLGLARLISPCRRKQAWLGLGLALAYVVATGAPVPALRAGALVLLLLLGQALDLETDSLVSLSFGLIVVLMLQPWALTEAGFQMSFGVTASLLFLSPLLARRLMAWRIPRSIAWFMALCLAVQAATLPLEAWHFHQLSWPAFFSGQLALPLLPAIISLSLCCALLGWALPALAAPFAWPLIGLSRCLEWGAAHLAALPGAAWSSAAPGMLWMLAWIMACVGLVWALRCKRVRPWALGLCIGALSLLVGARIWAGLPHAHPGLTKAYALAVGQGDGILMEFSDGRTLLVDGGPGRPDAGSWVVQPALRSLGISHLDGVAFTHADADHLGGLEWVLDQVPCKAVYETGLSSPSDYEHAQPWDRSLLERVRSEMRLKRLNCHLVRQGDALPGFPQVRVLWPPKELKSLDGRKDRNDSSLVLDVEGWLVLTGDLGKKGEKALLAANPALRQRQVLKLGHHGSRGASSSAFLERLQPRLALVSVGRANRFGFPHAETLERLPKGCRVMRTDEQGCLRLVHSQGGALEMASWH